MELSADGLPASAAARVERQRASGTAGSLLSAPAAAAVRAAGLVPAGEVFGCLVMNLGWSTGFCGAYGPGAQRTNAWGTASWQSTPVVISAGRHGLAPYAGAVQRAWDGALARMLAEARALGADGVVGVTTSRAHVSGQAQEFTALGTAVRWADPGRVGGSAQRGGPVWSAGLSGEDCAAAILSGYLPRGLALGMAVATKHDDWQVAAQRSSWSNTEVTGLTELVTTARSQARLRLAEAARRLGGGGDVVITAMGLREFETSCSSSSEEKDRHAEAQFVGTVLGPIGPLDTQGAAARARAPGAVLPVLPLTRATSRPAHRRPRRNQP